MIDPKTYYRELDALLGRIEGQKRDENFLFLIQSELEKRFGMALSFENSHLYEKRGNEFILIKSLNTTKDSRVISRLSMTSEAVKQVLKHGSFIYDNTDLALSFKSEIQNEPFIPVAIWIHSNDHQWLFVFELKQGWSREEMSLFLNTVRTAINYRFFADLMGSELEKAAQIQQSLLPKEVPKVEGYQIVGKSQPAELVGGDFYDYFQFDEDSFGVSLGDASGHGLPAALLVRDVVTGLRMGLAREMRVVHTIEKLNNILRQTAFPTSFVSMFIGEIEWDGHFFYTNAGHPPPILISENKVSTLKATGTALGFTPDIFLKRSYTYLDKGSVLVIYSDGIIERMNANGDLFGISNLHDFIFEYQHKTAQEILDLVFQRVYEYGGRTGWEDDATLVVVKRED